MQKNNPTSFRLPIQKRQNKGFESERKAINVTRKGGKEGREVKWVFPLNPPNTYREKVGLGWVGVQNVQWRMERAFFSLCEGKIVVLGHFRDTFRGRKVESFDVKLSCCRREKKKPCLEKVSKPPRSSDTFANGRVRKEDNFCVSI